MSTPSGNTQSDAAPLGATVSVLMHARVSGLGVNTDHRTLTMGRVMPLIEALTAEHHTDAHIQLIVAVPIADPPRQPRLKKESISLLAAQGYSVLVTTLFADFDGPDHKATDEWRASFDATVSVLPVGLNDPISYHTRGGARLVYPLSRPITPEQYERLVPQVLADLTLAGLEPDPACKDYTRLFRLPFVNRDNTGIERRPLYIGDGVLDVDRYDLTTPLALNIPTRVSPLFDDPTHSPRTTQRTSPSTKNRPGAFARAEIWMRSRTPAQVGQRNVTTHQTAFALFGKFDLTFAEVCSLIEDFITTYPQTASDPFTLLEARACVESAYQGSRNVPRGTYLDQDSPTFNPQPLSQYQATSTTSTDLSDSPILPRPPGARLLPAARPVAAASVPASSIIASGQSLPAHRHIQTQASTPALQIPIHIATAPINPLPSMPSRSGPASLPTARPAATSAPRPAHSPVHGGLSGAGVLAGSQPVPSTDPRTLEDLEVPGEPIPSNVRELRPGDLRGVALGGSSALPTESISKQIADAMLAEARWFGLDTETGIPYAGRARGDAVVPVNLNGAEAMEWGLDVAMGLNLALSKEARVVAMEIMRMRAKDAPVTLNMRFARDEDGGILIDSGDMHWTTYKCSPDGTWSTVVLEKPTFRRTVCTQALAVPDQDVEPRDLLVGLKSLLGYDDALTLQLACWTVAAMAPGTARYGLFLRGRSESGKSTCAKVLRLLIDPTSPDFCAPPYKLADPRDEVHIHSMASALVCYDNVSSFSSELSNLFCRMITGEGHIRRALRTDNDIVRTRMSNALMLTTISVSGAATDLQSRVLQVDMPPRSKFASTTNLEARRDAMLPKLVGATLATLAKALQCYDEIERECDDELSRLRMRDSATYYAAAARALGADPHVALQALLKARSDVSVGNAALDVVGAPILALVQNNAGKTVYFDGALGDLDSKLIGGAGMRPPDMWPRSLRALRSAIDRLAPDLAASGVKVEFYTSQGHTPRACVRVVRVGADIASPTPPVLAASKGRMSESDRARADSAMRRWVDQFGAVSISFLHYIAQGRVEWGDNEHEALEWMLEAKHLMSASPDERAEIIDAIPGEYITTSAPIPGQLAWRWKQNLDGAAERICDHVRTIGTTALDNANGTD